MSIQKKNNPEKWTVDLNLDEIIDNSIFIWVILAIEIDKM